MATPVPDPKKTKAFASSEAFETWLSAQHDKADELWLKIHKKDSGLKTISYSEAVDVALCWGWIDSVKMAFDANSFLQRFGPRQRRSVWSKINRERIERLIGAGRMQTPGLKHVAAAKADGRWEKAYEGAARMEMPPDLMAAIAAEPKAQALFETLNAANRYALAFRTHNMKTPAGREKKIASLVMMLKRGETPYPNGTAKAAAARKKAPK